MEIFNTSNTNYIYIYIFTWLIFAFLIYLEFGIVSSYIVTVILFILLSIYLNEKTIDEEEIQR